MDTVLQQTALMRFLKKRSPLYYGKVDEIHQAVRGWLSYIPQTLPHYTRHTIEHSIEIIGQLSSLLFKNRDPNQGVVNLSTTEAYILVASAYLHDAGMVASDREKSEILLSDEWGEWTASEGGAARWQKIQQFRLGNQPADESLRHFLADIQTRFLMAEFIRRSHHRRAAEILTLHQNSLGRFAFDDPLLLQAINEVCVAHGLKKHELEDRERFPDRRDIRGDQVNLCFLALLLRMADLLDISHDRACPLLLNAASPLPADSLAHWTQYQRIAHRLTAPDRIEVTAACENQEEHRYLRDWFQWLEDEVKNATVLCAHWQSHRDWRPPSATLQGTEPTIKIQKAPGATYIFGDWKLELDHEAIFERLVYDVHDRPEAFIRELIQNALDATRCRMYADYLANGLEPSEYPTQFPEEWRQRYPVQLTLEEREFPNDLSGKPEKRQVLIVEDYGIGMDQEIIQKYFLQIGRSYYITDEFRRRFKFNPTSRFGVGFLSVFAVSDYVVIETYKPESSDGPLRLTLTGPRNYLLLDKGQRAVSGTRIEIVLRNPLATGNLTDLALAWCRRVEFPIKVNDRGVEATIVAERPEDFTYEMPLVTDPKAIFALRTFPLNHPGVEGEIYVFALINEKGESWADYEWARDRYPEQHPHANPPSLPSRLYCINGITLKEEKEHAFMGFDLTWRLDLRRPLEHIPLSRIGSISYWDLPGFSSRLKEILEQHLAKTPLAQGEDGWVYKQKLVDIFPIKDFWPHQPGMIRVYKEGKSQITSSAEIHQQPLITTVIRPGGGYADAIKPEWDNRYPTLLEEDLNLLSDSIRRGIFSDRHVDEIYWLNRGFLALDWAKGKPEFNFSYMNIDFVEFPDCPSIAFPSSFIRRYSSNLIFNTNHPFSQWLFHFGESCRTHESNLRPGQFEKLLRILFKVVSRLFLSNYLEQLENYLKILRGIPGLPGDLKPPEIKFTEEIFKMKPPELLE